MTLGITLGVLLLLELIARMAGTPQWPPNPQFVAAPEWSYPDRIAKDAELFWRYRPGQTIRQPFFAPGTYRINAHGFRGPDFPDEKPSGVTRVVCLGGSTTFGWGVPDGTEYPRQLETRLNSLDPEHGHWEVINAGVTDYSTHQGLALAGHVLPRWRPDIVLFNFAWGDLQPAGKEIPDKSITMPPGWRVGLENILMRSVAAQYAGALISSATRSRQDTSSTVAVRRVDATSFVANAEKMVRIAEDLGARPIWVTSPIAWPPPGQSDTSGIFQYHHRYQRAAEYGAASGGGEVAELSNNFNRYRNLFDDNTKDIEHFNAAGHNFAADYLARFILRLPLTSDTTVRTAPAEPADQ